MHHDQHSQVFFFRWTFFTTADAAPRSLPPKQIFKPNAVVEEELASSMAFVKEKAKGNGHRLMVALVHWPSGQICLQDAEDILAGARKTRPCLRNCGSMPSPFMKRRQTLLRGSMYLRQSCWKWSQRSLLL